MDTKYSVKQKMLVFQAFSAIIAFETSVFLVPFVLLSGKKINWRDREQK